MRRFIDSRCLLRSPHRLQQRAPLTGSRWQEAKKLKTIRWQSAGRQRRHNCRRTRNWHHLFVTNLLQFECILDPEVTGTGPAKCGQMCAASKLAAELMNKAADVSARRTYHAECSKRRLQIYEFKFPDFDCYRCDLYRLVCARKLVRRYAADLLRGKRRRDLINTSNELLHRVVDFVGHPTKRPLSCCRRTFAVIGAR